MCVRVKFCCLGERVFVSWWQRDIYVGDAVEIFIITKDGVRKEVFPLKKD